MHQPHIGPPPSPLKLHTSCSLIHGGCTCPTPTTKYWTPKSPQLTYLMLSGGVSHQLTHLITEPQPPQLTHLVLSGGVNEVSRTNHIILDPRVVDMLHVVVMTTEVSSHSLLLQQWLQTVHQDLGGAMFSNRPHWEGEREEKRDHVCYNNTYKP